jgi:hypothetical protein
LLLLKAVSSLSSNIWIPAAVSPSRSGSFNTAVVTSLAKDPQPLQQPSASKFQQDWGAMACDRGTKQLEDNFRDL